LPSVNPNVKNSQSFVLKKTIPPVFLLLRFRRRVPVHAIRLNAQVEIRKEEIDPIRTYRILLLVIEPAGIKQISHRLLNICSPSIPTGHGTNLTFELPKPSRLRTVSGIPPIL